MSTVVRLREFTRTISGLFVGPGLNELSVEIRSKAQLSAV